MGTFAGVGKRNGTVRPRRATFHAFLGLFMLVFAVAGFWPQYYSVSLGAPIASHVNTWAVHAHAAIFLGWLVFHCIQTALVSVRRSDLHRRVGPAMAAFGLAGCLFGLLTGLLLAARMAERTADTDMAAQFVFAPIIDMVLFGAFLGIAVVWRKSPEIHKRAMVVATFSIAVVGIGRLVDRTSWFDEGWLWQPAILSPLLLALTYDLVVKRRVYGVLAAGFLAHWLRLQQDVYTSTEAWLPIGRGLIRPFAGA